MIAMASVLVDLVIFSVVGAAGIVFLLWVLYHLILESRQTRIRRRHSFSRISSVADRAGPSPKERETCVDSHTGCDLWNCADAIHIATYAGFTDECFALLPARLTSQGSRGAGRLGHSYVMVSTMDRVMCACQQFRFAPAQQANYRGRPMRPALIFEDQPRSNKESPERS